MTSLKVIRCIELHFERENYVLLCGENIRINTRLFEELFISLFFEMFASQLLWRILQNSNNDVIMGEGVC